MKLRKWLAIAAAIAGLAVLGACGSSNERAAGTSVPADADAVSREQGASAPSTSIKMPDLVGMNGAVAEDELKAAGFTGEIKFGTKDQTDSFVVLPENWAVTKQSHKPGKNVRANAVIVLTVTKE